MSILKANSLSNLAGTKSVPTDTMVDGSAKAWVNFNGTGTIATRDSFNVSSLTDFGTGVYAVNMVVALASINYTVTASNGTPGSMNGWASPYATANSAAAFPVTCLNSSNAVFDPSHVVCVANGRA